MALSLDGNTSFIGTEFIKLLNTGSSDLATVEYVDEQVALGGGGGGNVDLSNYYTQTEVDTLLNNKLNVNNPQDITGTLRIDSTNGNGKLIVNAVGAPNDEDFYVNGLSNLGGTLKAQVIQASSNIQTSQQIQSNVINTYSNSNLIIQRNAIPYITLDSQIVDDETVEKIILMKDVEFSGGLSLNTLSVDTLNTIGLNDMVFNVATLGEFLRFQVSDNTVRVPNTRSFLSQDIYLDTLRPLTFSNDVVLYGGNNANDAYEEYVRLDASAERMIVSKATKFENNIQFNVGQNISWTNVFIREVFSSRPEFDLIVNGSTSHLRLWVNGSVKQAITNTTIACKVNIDAEQGITVFNGQQLITNTINSHTNSDLLIQRDGSTAITLKADNVVQFSGYLNINNISTPDNTDLALRRSDEEFIRLYKDTSTSAEAIICSKEIVASSGIKNNIFDSDGNNNAIFQRDGIEYFRLTTASEADVVSLATSKGLSATLMYCNTYSTRVLTNDTIFLGANTAGNGRTEYMRYNHTGESVDFPKSVKTNTINSNGNNTLNIQQNGNTFISLFGNTLNRVQVNRFLRVVDDGGSNQAQFVNNSNGNYMEFRLGNHINAYASGTPVNGNTLHLNYYSHGNVVLGTNQDTGDDPIPTISINKFTSNTGNAFEVEGNSVFSGTVSTNTLNSESGDLVFQRDGLEYMRFQGSDATVRMNYSLISTNTYIDNHRPTAFGVDTFFYGNNSADNGYIEYFRFNHANQRCDYFVNINSNSNITCVDLVETSDKRLKDNILDVDEDCSEIVKKVNVKTYNLKSDDKKKNHIGFIAQEIKAILPDKFEAVVNEDSEYMGINYGKMSAILWKCCQEQQSKIEHLESSVYELQEELKDKKKSTPKSKAKAKSKSKAKNVD